MPVPLAAGLGALSRPPGALLAAGAGHMGVGGGSMMRASMMGGGYGGGGPPPSAAASGLLMNEVARLSGRALQPVAYMGYGGYM